MGIGFTKSTSHCPTDASEVMKSSWAFSGMESILKSPLSYRSIPWCCLKHRLLMFSKNLLCVYTWFLLATRQILLFINKKEMAQIRTAESDVWIKCRRWSFPICPCNIIFDWTIISQITNIYHIFMLPNCLWCLSRFYRPVVISVAVNIKHLKLLSTIKHGALFGLKL